MPIAVLCPKCHARFQVSEKFAGKQGPCPKCKNTITVPTLEEQVKVHAPEEYGAGVKDAKGRPVLKPIARVDPKVQPTTVAAIVVATVLAFAAAFVLGRIGEEPNVIFMAIGLVIISPPLVLAAYTFLRDPEIEPYRGKPLYIRVAICSAVYAVLWAVFGFFYPNQLEMWQYFVTAPLLLIGALTALATLDLEFGSAFFHYCFFLVLTMLLRVAMGLPALKAAVTESTI